MQAQTHSPAAIFGHDVRYVVPLFQRPYVWTRTEQWEPLWEDVRQVAERLLDAPQATYGSPSVPPPFLGAIVLEQQMNPAGFIGVRRIVDGQQRLTTLQILLDAAQLVVARHGEARDAQALKVLVLNEPSITRHRDEVFRSGRPTATRTPSGLRWTTAPTCPPPCRLQHRPAAYEAHHALRPAG